MAETKKTYKCDKKLMGTCKYGCYISRNTEGERYCNYLGIMHKRRGCSPEECDKYVKRDKDEDPTVD